MRDVTPVAFGVILVIAAIAVWHGALASSQGCPRGTLNESGLTVTCDNRRGGVVCVEWASGFTPIRRDQRIWLTYARKGVSKLGPWCRNASSPPPGDG